jgi:predicted RNA-binding protein with EMAP domain
LSYSDIDIIIGTTDILLGLMQNREIVGSLCGSKHWHAEYNQKWDEVDRARRFYSSEWLEPG